MRIVDEAGDYERIENAIQFLSQNVARQPGLSEVARHVHLSEFHFQRLFRRWAGVTPKRFLQVLTVELAKERLAQSENVLLTSLDSGLSGPGRLHDLFVNLEAVTPGEFKSRGAALTVRYGVHPTLFGKCLIGLTERGICHLGFIVPTDSHADALDELRRQWPKALLVHKPAETAEVIQRIFKKKARMTLYCAGTNFQAKVWNALLCIPPGRVASYQQIADALGAPRSARAVGQAVASNPIAYLIPCHRVIQKLGIIGNYRWGSARKTALLAWEAASQKSNSV